MGADVVGHALVARWVGGVAGQRVPPVAVGTQGGDQVDAGEHEPLGDRLLGEVGQALVVGVDHDEGRLGRVAAGGVDEVPDDLTGVIGVTAGASAPEDLVAAIVDRLAPRDGVEEVRITSEDEYFPPPRELRDLMGDDAVKADRATAASDVLAKLGR